MAAMKQETEIAGTDVDAELAHDLHHDHLASGTLICYYYFC